jgi:hypothetical protein
MLDTDGEGGSGNPELSTLFLTHFEGKNSKRARKQRAEKKECILNQIKNLHQQLSTL